MLKLHVESDDIGFPGSCGIMCSLLQCLHSTQQAHDISNLDIF